MRDSSEGKHTFHTLLLYQPQRGQKIEGAGIQSKKTTSAYQIEGGGGRNINNTGESIIIIKLISQPTEH